MARLTRCGLLTRQIADFGMGRGKAKKLEKAQNRLKLSLMEFISNRYYTAPEGLLPNNEYSYPGTHPRSLSIPSRILLVAVVCGRRSRIRS
jgi:hypothetical protein